MGFVLPAVKKSKNGAEIDREDRDAVKQWFVATFGSGDLVTKWSRDGLKRFREKTGKNLSKFSPAQIRETALKAYPQLQHWPQAKMG